MDKKIDDTFETTDKFHITLGLKLRKNIFMKK